MYILIVILTLYTDIIMTNSLNTVVFGFTNNLTLLLELYKHFHKF